MTTSYIAEGLTAYSKPIGQARFRHAVSGRPCYIRRALTPVVSILLPAFDAAATLPACLRSLARQTETRWECIAVDDGSRDGTRALLDAFARRDPRLRVVATPHRGLVAALNDGLARCRAPLVARMDADDVMHRERLARQLAALAARPALAAVGCHVRLFPRAGLRDGMRDYEAWLNTIDDAARVRAEAFVECPIVHPTLLARTDALRALGWRDCGWPEDYDLILRLLAAGHDVGIVPRRLHAWRDHPTRLSRTAPIYAQARFTACKAAFLAAGFLAGRDTYVLCGHGGTGRALRRALAGHGKRPSHIVEVHPGRLGQRIHGAPVVPYDAVPSLGRVPFVVSVAGVGPRTEARRVLEGAGLRETRDFVCAA
jgi:GT2 family glycosyltransferase